MIEPVLDGVTICFSKEVKYLGITLDAKLLSNSHLSKIKKKAIGSLMAGKSIIGQKWSLKPKMMHWVYSVLVGNQTDSHYVW